MRTYKIPAILVIITVLVFPGSVSAEWTLEFSVSVPDSGADEGRTLTRLEAGVSPLASDGFDNALDVVAFPGGFIQSFFNHSGEAEFPGSLEFLWRDIRSETLPQFWDIRIISSQNTDPITLSWSNPPILPSDFCYAGAVELMDGTSGEAVDLNGFSSLTFFSTGTLAVPDLRSYHFTAAYIPLNAPGAPGGLISRSKKRQIVLDWDDTSSDLAGYHVWRSSVSGSGFEKITPLPLSRSLFRDRDVMEGATYFYVVSALAENGCESGFSNETSGVSGGSGGR